MFPKEPQFCSSAAPTCRVETLMRNAEIAMLWEIFPNLSRVLHWESGNKFGLSSAAIENLLQCLPAETRRCEHSVL